MGLMGVCNVGRIHTQKGVKGKCVFDTGKNPVELVLEERERGGGQDV